MNFDKKFNKPKSKERGFFETSPRKVYNSFSRAALLSAAGGADMKTGSTLFVHTADTVGVHCTVPVCQELSRRKENNRFVKCFPLVPQVGGEQSCNKNRKIDFEQRSRFVKCFSLVQEEGSKTADRIAQ